MLALDAVAVGSTKLAMSRNITVCSKDVANLKNWCNLARFSKERRRSTSCQRRLNPAITAAAWVSSISSSRSTSSSVELRKSPQIKALKLRMLDIQELSNPLAHNMANSLVTSHQCTTNHLSSTNNSPITRHLHRLASMLPAADHPGPSTSASYVGFLRDAAPLCVLM